jgi:MFS family permease
VSTASPLPSAVALWSAFAARILLPFAAGYFLSYLYRTVNAVIAGGLTDDPTLGNGGLDAGSLGLLTSAYFLTFAAAQVPLGILLDRYGPRRVEAALLVVAAIGAAVFAMADGLAGLIAGRALIGLGVSACLMGAFKAFRQWFASERLPLLQGLIMAAGGLGVMTATVPVEAALQFTDWRGVFFGLAGLTLVVCAVLFLGVPDRPSEGAHETLRQQMRGVSSVFTSRFFWAVVPAAMVAQAIYMSMQGLWAGPWLRDVAGIAEPGTILLITAIAMVAGHLLTGALAERLARAGIPTVVPYAVGSVLFLGVVMTLASGVTAVPWLLWGLFGLFGTSGVLSYAIVAQAFPAHMAGRVNTAVNLMVFVFAFVVQWGIGAVIDLWGRDAAGHYPADAYTVAFGSTAMLQAVAVGWLLWSLAAMRRQNEQTAQG